MNTVKRNYSNELERIIKTIDTEKPPSLLLHACCAPCSSYVLEYLANFFRITVLFYNPNISSFDEYKKRKNELKKFLAEFPQKNKVQIFDIDYDNSEFEREIFGFENEPEGGARCLKCYRLRLLKTAEIAKDDKFDYFTTTLSISPMKNSKILNEIGEELAEKFEISHLPSDFKKKEGYKRSIELSKIYNLYRQNYCGCKYSQNQNVDM